MYSSEEMLQVTARCAVSLVEEIVRLESRLRSMGEDGDCAYERAISRLYETMVQEKKAQLTALRASGL